MNEAEARRADDRAHDRYSLGIAARVLLVGGAAIEATVQNISYGGLSVLAADGALPLGADVEVTLAIETGEVCLGGVVCWRRGAVVGVRFEGLRRAARLTVQTLVDDARRRGA